MRNAKQDNTIEITEDVRVPGTDVILEAGDKIKILKEASGDVKDLINSIYSYLSSGTYSISGPSSNGVIKVKAPLGGGSYKEFTVTVQEVGFRR